jgi:hypothetical protein
VGFIAHLFVEWLRTGLAADLCWGVPGHDAPWRFSGKSAAAADGKDGILSFFHSFAIYKAMQEWHK